MKKNLFKRLILPSLALVLLLYGCGSKDKKSAEKTDNKDKFPTEDVTIKFAWWGADNRHDAMKKVVKLYEQKHPNVTVKVEYGAWDGWQAKTLTQLSGKTEADVMQVNYNWLFSYGKGKNVFYDLNKVKDTLKLSNWDKSYLKAMQVDGQQAAVPQGMAGRVSMYNQKLYTANDVEIPTTYSELEKVGKVIAKNNTATGAKNQYSFQNMGKVSKDLFIAQMLYNNYGKVMQTKGKVNYTVKQVKAVLEDYQELENSGAMPKYNQDPSIDTNANPEWVNGQVGGIYEWTNSLAQWAESYQGGKAEGDLTIGKYLQVKKGTTPTIYVKPNFGYAISKNTKNPVVAADFINFIFTNKAAVKAESDALGYSINKVTKKLQDDSNLLQGVVKDSYMTLAKYKQVVLDPYFEDDNVRNERYTAIESFRSGKSTAAEAAKIYVEKQQEALDKYYQD